MRWLDDPAVLVVPLDQAPAWLAARAHEPGGRPYLPDSSDALSLARSGGLLAVGRLTGGRLGVDLEVWRPDLDVAAAVEVVLADSERAWWDPTWAYRLWTAKEAWLKALGLGLGYGAEQLACAPDEHGRLRPVALAGKAEPARGWTLAQHDGPGWTVAAVWCRYSCDSSRCDAS